MSLSDLKIRHSKPAEKPYKLRDENGLYLDIRPSGKKVWRCRFKINGKEGVVTLGHYPDLSLSDARSERDLAKANARSGVNPSELRKQKKLTPSTENTFQAIATEYYEKNVDRWSPAYAEGWLRKMRKYAYPAIGNTPIKEVNPHDILTLMKSMEAKAPTTAITLRGWCSAIFRYAIVTLRTETDPAAPLIGAVKRKTIRHNPGLSKNEISELIVTIENSKVFVTTQYAVWLLLLLFVRTKELRMAEWKEIDWKAKVWIIPAEKMKKKRKHIVPLSEQVIDLLLELKEHTGHCRWLLPSANPKSQYMSHSTVNIFLSRYGWSNRFSAHGFRTTASTLLHEMGYRSELIERQLAHADSNAIRAAYNHAEYLDERRKMMQTWSDFIWQSGGRLCMLHDPFINT